MVWASSAMAGGARLATSVWGSMGLTFPGVIIMVLSAASSSESVDGAAKRDLGDTGGFAWGRRNAASNPAPLIAVTNARWGALHHPGPPARPVVAAL